jgi:UDP-2,4-diacetamido-2,4,6-trideoxy-beta-L-altropyranose hydrolase
MAMSPAEPKASSPRILFLPDCGPEVGGGHVMRCLALARALAARGASCAMLAPPAAAGVLDAFAPEGLQRIEIGPASGEELVEMTCEAARRWPADVVFLDHYGLAEAEERRLAETRAAVAVIDDLADRPHACRLLVDPSLGRTAEAYRLLTPADCHLLAGPDYALLAPDYGKGRATALAARRPADPPRRLLISLGLMDLRGITASVLQLIGPQFGTLEADVVVGGTAPSLPELLALAKTDPRVRLHVDSRDMAGLIASADIGIGAGGVSTWERAALGLPSISLILADNQRQLALDLDRMGAVLAVEAWGKEVSKALPAAFARLASDGRLRSRLSETSASLCDGQGAGRVADAVLALV